MRAVRPITFSIPTTTPTASAITRSSWRRSRRSQFRSIRSCNFQRGAYQVRWAERARDLNGVNLGAPAHWAGNSRRNSLRRIPPPDREQSAGAFRDPDQLDAPGSVTNHSPRRSPRLPKGGPAMRSFVVSRVVCGAVLSACGNQQPPPPVERGDESSDRC